MKNKLENNKDSNLILLTLNERQEIYRERNNGMILNFDSEYRLTKAFDEMGIPKFSKKKK